MTIEKREFTSLIFLEGNLLDSKEEGVSLRVGWNDPFDFNPTRIILGISRKEEKKKRKKKEREGNGSKLKVWRRVSALGGRRTRLIHLRDRYWNKLGGKFSAMFHPRNRPVTRYTIFAVAIFSRPTASAPGIELFGLWAPKPSKIVSLSSCRSIGSPLVRDSSSRFPSLSFPGSAAKTASSVCARVNRKLFSVDPLRPLKKEREKKGR